MTTFMQVSLASAALVGALVGAPSSAASPQSDFCGSLASAGISGDCATLTALAQDVCAQKDRGVDLGTVVQKLDATTKNENLSNYIIAGAQLYFCPDDKATA
jgi:hypothetical protein